MEIILRKDAKEKGFKFYFTNKPCKNGHVDKRYTVDGCCLSCAKVKAQTEEHKQRCKNYYTKNKEDYLKKCSERYYSNKEFFREYNSKYYLENKEDILRSNKKYREENKHILKKKSREYRKNNKHITNACSARKRAVRKERTLRFSDMSLEELNEFCIKEVYKQSQDVSELLGYDHHVDHIVPLKGANVSGLHVWYNLQVLGCSENSIKNNKFVPYWENHLTGEIFYGN